jgi:hypothetical protein
MSTGYLIRSMVMLSCWVLAASTSLHAQDGTDASKWTGLYRSSDGEVLRLKGDIGVLVMETFIAQPDGSWKVITAWATTKIKRNYAEFRQPSEPHGLWVSLSLKNNYAIVRDHNGTSYRSQSRALYERLSSTEAARVVGLPN